MGLNVFLERRPADDSSMSERERRLRQKIARLLGEVSKKEYENGWNKFCARPPDHSQESIDRLNEELRRIYNELRAVCEQQESIDYTERLTF